MTADGGLPDKKKCRVAGMRKPMFRHSYAPSPGLGRQHCKLIIAIVRHGHGSLAKHQLRFGQVSTQTDQDQEKGGALTPTISAAVLSLSSLNSNLKAICCVRVALFTTDFNEVW